jgi:glycosyltransferase involved in cell wall biosynthesis
VTHYGDYNLDYERFFYENQYVLEECGIAHPWLSSFENDLFGQLNLHKILLKLQENDKNVLDSLVKSLENRQRLLLVAPVGLLGGVETLVRLLREGQILPEWLHAETRCVWLACNRGREIEGAYRKNLPTDSAEDLYKNCQDTREGWLEKLAATLRCADAGKCFILQDDSEIHIPAETILEYLGLPLPLERCKALRNTQAKSREILYIAKKLKSLFPFHHDPIEQCLQDFDSHDAQTFLEPSRLEAINKAYCPAMEKLAQCYGGVVSFDALASPQQWMPFVPPKTEKLLFLVEKVLSTSSPAMRNFSLRIIAKAWDASLFGPDAESYVQGLVSRLGEQALPTPLVSVLTLAKNHEHFIAECIESVLAQQTNFAVEHIIVDDCSTDGTRQIIADYAYRHESISPVFLSGGAKPGRNVLALFQKCRSKYVAICDGDDYFTDPLKLQKQVNFLDKHRECSLCFHPVDVVYEDDSPTRVYPPEDFLQNGCRRFYTLKDMLFANLIQTNSVMYRWRFRDGLPGWFDPSLVPSDWYWHLLHAEVGLIGFMRENMAVYRRHAKSLYASAEGSHVAHRSVHGLEELRTYSVCNKHFRGRYYHSFYRLAVGVFADFLKIYCDSGDDWLLQKACSLYPDFARDFLAQIQIRSGSQRQEQ